MDWDDGKDILRGIGSILLGFLVVAVIIFFIITSTGENGIKRALNDPFREIPKILEEQYDEIPNILKKRIDAAFGKETNSQIKTNEIDLSARKAWTTKELHIGKAYFETIWRDGQLYYQFYLDLNHTISGQLGSQIRGIFYIDLEDESGFKLGQLSFDTRGIVLQNDENGNTLGLSMKDSTYSISAETYKRSSQWQVFWAGNFDKIFGYVPPAKPIITNQFTNGSSKNEVLKIQGQPTSGDNFIWWYGYSYVTFDPNGRVNGWHGENLNARMTSNDD